MGELVSGDALSVGLFDAAFGAVKKIVNAGPFDTQQKVSDACMKLGRGLLDIKVFLEHERVFQPSKDEPAHLGVVFLRLSLAKSFLILHEYIHRYGTIPLAGKSKTARPIDYKKPFGLITHGKATLSRLVRSNPTKTTEAKTAKEKFDRLRKAEYMNAGFVEVQHSIHDDDRVYSVELGQMAKHSRKIAKVQLEKLLLLDEESCRGNNRLADDIEIGSMPLVKETLEAMQRVLEGCLEVFTSDLVKDEEERAAAIEALVAREIGESNVNDLAHNARLIADVLSV